jgi:tripartite-type tricarboxylate transporter receptor subunit TctC
MRPNRTRTGGSWLFTAAFIPLVAAAANTDTAANYPGRPVRFIVPFNASGGTDTTARTLAQKLSAKFGQQFVVDNRPGAAGSIGVDVTAKATPDGYTICLVSASHAISSATNANLPYDLTKDLQPITQATSLFFVLYLHPSVPAASVQELIGYSRANPDKLFFGSSGIGSLRHFAGEMFDYLSGAKMTHAPYKGGPAVLAAMLAGEVQVGYSSMVTLRPHLNAKRVRALAITAARRSPAMPELPTIAESGVKGYEVDQWNGVVASAKVPKAIVDTLYAAFAEVLKQPDTISRFAVDGSTVVAAPPEQFGARIRSDIEKWRHLAVAAGLKLDR